MQDVCTDAEMFALLKDAQRGVPAAYDRLYNLYADRIFRYVYARLGQREAAEDLTADVFVRLIQVLPRFRVNAERPVASFSAWLYRIASNLLTDHHRRQRHRQHADLAEHAQAPRSTGTAEPTEVSEATKTPDHDGKRVRGEPYRCCQPAHLSLVDADHAAKNRISQEVKGRDS